MGKLAQRFIAGTGIQVDTLGFGCASLGNLYHPVNDSDAAETLKTAWDEGFRYFDTAPHYGQGLSERRIGDMLRPLQGKEYLLSSKVGRLLKPTGYADMRHGFASPMPFDIHYDYSYDGIMRSFEDSIQRLGLDRIDILYMHDIGEVTHGDAHEHHFKIAMDGGYKAMDELRSQGYVSAIGLGVNEYQVCEAALEHGDWDCFLLAGRYTLLEQKSLHGFLPKCLERNCSIIVGGPYNSGILASGVKGKNTPFYNYVPAPVDVIKRVEHIENICHSFGVTLAAAALQFPLAHPAVASVIPGLGGARRVLNTLELFNEEIPFDFWTELKNQGLIDSDSPVPAA
ncbi:MAG: aldo/keto reductase [Candidatus Azotimanducaceae bacterium WSBS_2022_MAG_OTU7]